MALFLLQSELSSIVSPLEEALKVTEQLTNQQNEKIEQHKVSLLLVRAFDCVIDACL